MPARDAPSLVDVMGLAVQSRSAQPSTVVSDTRAVALDAWWQRFEACSQPAT